jgi:hypothetical protein
MMYRWRGLGTINYPSIDAAIAQFEGSGPGTLATRNNNPGNMVYSPWMAQFGCSPGGAGGFAQCPSADAGQQILDYRVSQLVDQGDSVSQLLNVWAGPQYPGNTVQSYNNYVSSVSAATGLDPNAPINQQLSTDASVPDVSLPSDSGTAVDASGAVDLSSLLSTEPNWTLIALAAGAGLLLLLAAR